MQFLLIAHDASDGKALERRLAHREKHLESITQLKRDGKALYGAALIDETGAMKGSVLIMNFETREEFDRYIENEPYVIGRVWHEIEVKPCRVPALFME